MAIKKLKLAWVENNNSRTISFRKRRAGLIKKVKELSVLCDVKACMIIFNPNEVEPMIWPSFEAARGLLDRFFALPEVLQKKKEVGIESYLKERTKKVHVQFMKIHEKNMEYDFNQLMVQLHRGRRFVDLNLSEIYTLLIFSRDMLTHYRKMLGFVTYPPLRDPPTPPIEVQSQNILTSTDDGFVRSGQDDEGAGKTDEEVSGRISIGTLMDNKSIYLIDEWVFPPEPPISSMYQQVGMTMVSSEVENPNLGSYRPFQGSSSNGNPFLEMEPVDPQRMTFHGFVGSMSQPLQHYNNPIMAMSQPSEYPFDFTSPELGVIEEGSYIDNEQFLKSSNTITTNDGVSHEPSPNGTTTSQDQIEPAEISSLYPTRRLY